VNTFHEFLLKGVWGLHSYYRLNVTDRGQTRNENMRRPAGSCLDMVS